MDKFLVVIKIKQHNRFFAHVNNTFVDNYKVVVEHSRFAPYTKTFTFIADKNLLTLFLQDVFVAIDVNELPESGYLGYTKNQLGAIIREVNANPKRGNDVAFTNAGIPFTIQDVLASLGADCKSRIIHRLFSGYANNINAAGTVKITPATEKDVKIIDRLWLRQKTK